MELTKQYILNLYDLLANDTQRNVSKAQLLYSIINLKSDYNALINEHQSLYIDVKMFIAAYLTEISCLDYGYDQPCIAKLQFVCKSLTFRQQRNIINIIITSFYQYDKIVQWAKRYKYKNALNISVDEWVWYNPLSYLNFIISWILCNPWNIIIIFIIIFCILCVVLWPACNVDMACLEFNKQIYSGNYVWNHIVNVFCAVFHIEEDVCVTPLNTLGVVLIGIYKILIILIIVNYLYNKLLDLISLEDAK